MLRQALIICSIMLLVVHAAFAVGNKSFMSKMGIVVYCTTPAAALNGLRCMGGLDFDIPSEQLFLCILKLTGNLNEQT